jgi:hypothetical protein
MGKTLKKEKSEKKETIEKNNPKEFPEKKKPWWKFW